MTNYDSLSEASSDLKKKGYEDDFSAEPFCLYCSDLDLRLDPEDFHIDEIDKVEGDTNPGGEGTALYAVSSSFGVKGIQNYGYVSTQ
jgi:hypothetical protein